MANRGLRGWAVAALAASMLAGGAAVAADPKPAHKWRIEVSEGANNDGTIRFVVTPVGGEITTVEIPIRKGRGENDVAKDVRDGFVKALPAGIYEVEVDDGEDVLVKKHGSTPNFDMIVVRNTADGLRIHLQRE